MKARLHKKINWSALRRDDRGTQLVELAIVVPLLLMLLGGVAEFGRFFYTYTTLAKATRAGSRYLVSQPPGTGDTAARNLVVYGNAAGTGAPVVAGLTTANVEITTAKVGGTPRTTVRIQNFTYAPLFDLGKLTKNPSLSLAVNVGASSTMKQLVQ